MKILEEKQKLGYIFIECDKRGFKVDFVGRLYILNMNKKNEITFNSMKEVRNYIENL